MLRVLAHPTYRRLFTAQVLALLGTGLATVALGLLAYDLAGADAGAVLGTALTIKMVAYVSVSPLVGAVAARLPRRAFLACASTLRAICALGLPLVSEPWQVYLLILLLQAASAAYIPVFQATIPDVLTDERDYTRALSLSRLAYDLESLASPLVAAALLTVVGYDTLFLGTGAGFLAASGLVLLTRLPRSRSDAGAGRTGPALGLGAFLKVPRLRALLAMNLAVASATAVVLVDTVVIVRDVLGRDQSAVALTLGAFGAGSMIVALTLPRILDRAPDRAVMLPSGFVLALGLTVAALTLSVTTGAVAWAGVIGCWFVLGAGTSLVLTPAGRLLRRSAAPSQPSPGTARQPLRGEAAHPQRTPPAQHSLPVLFAAQFALSHACFLLTYPLAGWLGARAGQPFALGVFALLALAAAGAAAALWRRREPAGAARSGQRSGSDTG
ncbi:MFS transporter [Nocardiopsis sp. CNR-923]|uniref:MFS transporter n=1 Tax=Nocardiopsis sp. CNR-923 TaxID=1904965 RepID=UPI00095B0E25|nr:MFS transporter [Nocardiopsis sp. CNR-923]OLT26035.1 MFS transporter [Nocardiopsis sp. CNR-923]